MSNISLLLCLDCFYSHLLMSCIYVVFSAVFPPSFTSLVFILPQFLLLKQRSIFLASPPLLFLCVLEILIIKEANMV